MVQVGSEFLGNPKEKGCGVGVREGCVCVAPKGGEDIRSQECQLLESSKLGRYVADKFITVKFSVGAANPESHGSKRAGVQLP